jgi:hypothetical protein
MTSLVLLGVGGLRGGTGGGVGRRSGIAGNGGVGGGLRGGIGGGLRGGIGGGLRGGIGGGLRGGIGGGLRGCNCGGDGLRGDNVGCGVVAWLWNPRSCRFRDELFTNNFGQSTKLHLTFLSALDDD